MSRSMSPLVAKAREFSTLAHRRIDHRRKYSRQPYESHLKAVAEMVQSVTDDQEMIAAAWLHDVVEDTEATLDDVRCSFGSSVSDLVEELTDISRPSDGNRKKRKELDLAHTAQASPRAKTIKLADLCDNAVDICEADSKFASVYLREMECLLNVLQEGNSRLLAKAGKIHLKYSARLPNASATSASMDGVPSAQDVAELHQVRRQMNAFAVADIAEPIACADGAGNLPASSAFQANGAICGLLQNKTLVAYQRADMQELARHPGAWITVRPEQILAQQAPLSELVHVLTRYDFAFIQNAQSAVSVLQRSSLERPIGRMWLFGMLTLIDMHMTHQIGKCFATAEWMKLLSTGRLAKANELLAERWRRNQSASLLNCLQLTDKFTILISDAQQLSAWGYSSKGAAVKASAGLESLRNHLAHGQDLVSHHWPEIARMTKRLDESIREYSGVLDRTSDRV